MATEPPLQLAPLHLPVCGGAWTPGPMWEANCVVTLAWQQVSCRATAADSLAVAKEQGPCALLHEIDAANSIDEHLRCESSARVQPRWCMQPDVIF